MADRDAEPTRPGAERTGRDVPGARPIGEVPGRRPTQMETLRTGLLGDLGAEFLGTFVLIAFGDGVVAMAVAGLNQSGRGMKIFDASGDWLLITWGWAIAVTMGVYVAGGVTGAHLNPAVTFAFAVRRAFPWSRVPAYWLAQVLGAFVAAALVFIVYYAAIGSWEQANHVTRGSLGSFVTYSIFATFPAPYFLGNPIWPLIDQIVGTAFLLMLNPARDFGPRLFAALAGWGQVALPGNGPWYSNYFWVPIVGPLVGGVIGVFVYEFFIKNVLIARGVVESEP